MADHKEAFEQRQKRAGMPTVALPYGQQKIQKASHTILQNLPSLNAASQKHLLNATAKAQAYQEFLRILKVFQLESQENLKSLSELQIKTAHQQLVRFEVEKKFPLLPVDALKNLSTVRGILLAFAHGGRYTAPFVNWINTVVKRESEAGRLQIADKFYSPSRVHSALARQRPATTNSVAGEKEQRESQSRTTQLIEEIMQHIEKMKKQNKACQERFSQVFSEPLSYSGAKPPPVEAVEDQEESDTKSHSEASVQALRAALAAAEKRASEMEGTMESLCAELTKVNAAKNKAQIVTVSLVAREKAAYAKLAKVEFDKMKLTRKIEALEKELVVLQVKKHEFSQSKNISPAKKPILSSFQKQNAEMSEIIKVVERVSPSKPHSAAVGAANS